jgi:hypothetical protein
VIEQDTPPQANTWRRFVWATVAGIGYLRAHWGRRLAGGAIGIMADLISEGSTQAFYSRLPGHHQQAPDSLAQVGADRDLHRFRGETTAKWLARVIAAWSDYAQGGTPQQVLRALNQWGEAGWPLSWDADQVTLEEDPNPTVFEFTITIPFGLIDPPWEPWLWDDGHSWDDVDLYWDIGATTDIPMLLYLIRKWKPARSKCKAVVFWSETESVEFTI